jgi:hypothetical protein
MDTLEVGCWNSEGYQEFVTKCNRPIAEVQCMAEGIDQLVAIQNLFCFYLPWVPFPDQSIVLLDTCSIHKFHAKAQGSRRTPQAPHSRLVSNRRSPLLQFPFKYYLDSQLSSIWLDKLGQTDQSVT